MATWGDVDEDDSSIITLSDSEDDSLPQVDLHEDANENDPSIITLSDSEDDSLPEVDLHEDADENDPCVIILSDSEDDALLQVDLQRATKRLLRILVNEHEHGANMQILPIHCEEFGAPLHDTSTYSRSTRSLLERLTQREDTLKNDLQGTYHLTDVKAIMCCYSIAKPRYIFSGMATLHGYKVPMYFYTDARWSQAEWTKINFIGSFTDFLAHVCMCCGHLEGERLELPSATSAAGLSQNGSFDEAKSTTQLQPFRFLDLPLELRTQVIRGHLEQRVCLIASGKTAPMLPIVSFKIQVIASEPALHLCLANREVYNEVEKEKNFQLNCVPRENAQEVPFVPPLKRPVWFLTPYEFDAEEVRNIAVTYASLGKTASADIVHQHGNNLESAERCLMLICDAVKSVPSPNPITFHCVCQTTWDKNLRRHMPESVAKSVRVRSVGIDTVHAPACNFSPHWLWFIHVFEIHSDRPPTTYELIPTNYEDVSFDELCPTSLNNLICAVLGLRSQGQPIAKQLAFHKDKDLRTTISPANYAVLLQLHGYLDATLTCEEGDRASLKTIQDWIPKLEARVFSFPRGEFARPTENV